MADGTGSKASQAADRYAQAAFDLALEQDALDAVDKDFALLDAAFAESADLRAAARSPLIDPEAKSRALVAVAGALGVSALGRNVIGVAAANGRAGELPAIAQAYRARLAMHRGARQVEIISAQALAPAELERILAALRTALGKDVAPKLSVDPALIGGFIVRAGSRQFDASIRSKLDSLKLALKAG